MATPESIQADLDGIALNQSGLTNGQLLPWRIVHLLRDAAVGDLSTQTDGDAESPNISASIFDQVATLAKILTRRYKGKDIWDLVCEIHDAVVK